mgnify:CR=1 FL=1
MSRTFRTNKYGEVKTDKFKKKGLNWRVCAYCEHLNKDFRNDHRELHSKNQIIEDENYIPDRYNEVFCSIDDEDHELDEINNEILKHNQELNN